MLFRSSFCSIGAREMLQSFSSEAGESVEKYMKSLIFDEISDIFEHFGGMEAPLGQSYKKNRKKQPRGQKTSKKSPHFGVILGAFWSHFLTCF